MDCLFKGHARLAADLRSGKICLELRDWVHIRHVCETDISDKHIVTIVLVNEDITRVNICCCDALPVKIKTQLDELFNDSCDLTLVEDRVQLGERLVSGAQRWVHQEDLVVTDEDFLHFEQDVVIDAAHELARLLDALEGHVVLLDDRLAKLRLACRLLCQETRNAVCVALSLLLEHIVEVQHVSLCALAQKIVTIEVEQGLEVLLLFLCGVLPAL